MTGSRLILTGASGMLGRTIIEQLADRDGIAVLALYRSAPPASSAKNVENRMVDFARDDQITSAVQDFRPTIVIHSAATGMLQPMPDEASLRAVNVELPVRLGTAAHRAGNAHFVFLSSSLAYQDQGRPLTEDDPLKTAHPYGLSKILAEQELRELADQTGLPLTVIRPFSYTGKGDTGSRLFPSLLRSAGEGKPFAMSSGAQVRDHSHVDDIARGVISAALRPPGVNDIFNFGSGDTRSLRQLVEAVVNELGLPVEVQFGARPASPHEPKFLVANTGRARAVLGWQPRKTLVDAVRELAQSSLPSLALRPKIA